MPKCVKKQSSTVRRITIDEILAAGLIRILVTELKPRKMEFDDDPDYWETEKDILMKPDEFGKIMGMSTSDLQLWPWDTLYEGQTFLHGHFILKSNLHDFPRFLVNRGETNYMCVNSLIKQTTKELYFSAIKGGENDG